MLVSVELISYRTQIHVTMLDVAHVHASLEIILLCIHNVLYMYVQFTAQELIRHSLIPHSFGTQTLVQVCHRGAIHVIVVF